MENFRSIEIRDLCEYGLNPQDYFQGGYGWSVDGSAEFSVDYKITVGENPETRYLYLRHKQNKQTVFYRVRLVSLPTNTGRGKRWFFICPLKGVKCTKLFHFNNYFRSRKSLESLSYHIAKVNLPETLFDNAFSINAPSKPNKELKKWAGVFETSEMEIRNEIPFGLFFSQKLKGEKVLQ